HNLVVFLILRILKWRFYWLIDSSLLNKRVLLNKRRAYYNITMCLVIMVYFVIVNFYLYKLMLMGEESYMNSFLDFKSIRTKLILIALSLLIVPLFTLGTIIFYKAKGTLDEQGVKGLASSVEMTIEMIDALNDQVETAGLSLEEAQEKVKVAILGEMDEYGNRTINKNIDIGENGYLFILDQSGREIAHPTSEGTDHWDLEDSKGNKFVQEMIEKANNGGGVTRYEWHLPNDESKVEEKIVYSKA